MSVEGFRKLEANGMSDFTARNELMIKEIGEQGLHFFAAFSRMEFALKAAGFRIFDKYLKVYWPNFAETLPEDIVKRCNSDEHARPLIEQPPLKQTLKNEKLDWGERVSVDSPGNLVEALKTLRNNLFHGGKSIPLESRDQELIPAGLRVIELMLECTTSDEVWGAYFDRLPQVRHRSQPE
jgi:hypothetical protein